MNTPLTKSIFIYWLAGGISLTFTLLFTAKHLANFFPNVAILHYLRRIEYMGIFFIAFWSVKSIKDIYHYLGILIFTLLCVNFYGFGQRLLGFPAFLTMNEEFAKGQPLYLAPSSRLTSTFAGHYDLAAYLVFMIAFFAGIISGIKNKIGKIALLLISIFSLILLLLTASRISFAVYLITITITLWWLNKKKYLLPVIIGSFVLLSLVNGASERFLKTIRVRQVVYDASTGKAIGTLENTKDSVQKEEKIYVPITTETKENLPVGSKFIDLPQSINRAEEATTVAHIKKPVAQSLKMSTVSAEIATISGKFLIKKALVYDISLTTRIQGEWPRAIEAFKRNIILGSGYSSISLSNDNDYLRMLAETGLLGSFSFLLVFFTLSSYLYNSYKKHSTFFIRSLIVGFAGGFLGLAINAVFIDIFEASKIAFTFWLLAGLSTGLIALTTGYKTDLLSDIKKIRLFLFKLFTTNFAVFFYLLLFTTLYYKDKFGIYFIGDDFIWLKWAATATLNDLYKYFVQSDGFFYRPLAKTAYFVFYNIFWLKPFAYHLFGIILHTFCSYLIYLLAKKLTHLRLLSFVSAILFALLSVHSESLYWIPASFELISPLFVLLSFYYYLSGRFALSAILYFPALLGHESAIFYPLIIFVYDLLYKKMSNKKYIYLLFVLIAIFYVEIRYLSSAHWLNGDYSINFAKLPLNIFGNLISYFSVFLFGTSGMENAGRLRLFFRSYLSLSYFLVIAISLIFFYLRKRMLNNFPKLFLFFLLSFFIALLPFLGLGNISMRYAYLSSGWLILFLVYGLFDFTKRILPGKKSILAFSLVLVVFTIIQIRDNTKVLQDWKRAGSINYLTLGALRNNYLDKTENTTFNVVNIPIKYGQAWVFPVGFEQGLWHVFGDKSPLVVKTSDLTQALKNKEKDPQKNYVFIFDNFEIKEIK